MKFLRFLILCAIFPTMAMLPNETPNQAINQQIKTLRNTIKRLNKQLKKAPTKARVDELTNKIEELRNHLKQLTKKHTDGWLTDSYPEISSPKDALRTTQRPESIKDDPKALAELAERKKALIMCGTRIQPVQQAPTSRAKPTGPQNSILTSSEAELASAMQQ